MISKIPSISIVIPSHNRYEDLKECIKSIQKNNYPKNKYEIIVVDDFSTDNTKDIKKIFPKLKFIRNNKNMGASYSRNVGVQNSEYNFIAFTDSDAVVSRNWLEVISKHTEEDTILAGKVINYYNKKEEFGPRTSTFLGGSIKASTEKANVANSCNMIISKKIWKDIKGFDENIFVYFEESDFCIRARKLGYDIAFLPSLTVFHKNNSSLTGIKRYFHTTNKTYAMLKNYKYSKIRMLTFILLNLMYSFLLSAKYLALWDTNSSFMNIKGPIKGIIKFLRTKC